MQDKTLFFRHAPRRLAASQTHEATEQRAANQYIGDLGQARMHRSTILAGNIHCATCVNHIQNALSQIGPEIQDVSVRLDEITVVHRDVTATGTLIQIISDEGFDVYSARTTNSDERVIFEKSLDPSVDGWFDDASEKWVASPFRRTVNSWLPTGSEAMPCARRANSRKKQRHLENCLACREKHKDPAVEKSVPVPKSVLEKQHVQGLDHVVARATLLSTVDGANDAAQQPPPASDEATAPNTKIWKITLSIGGMTCAACTNAITEMIRSLKPVHEVQIDLMTNSGSLVFEGLEDYAEQIVNEIEDIGYDARIIEKEPVEAPTQQGSQASITTNTLYRAQLSIEGMTCAACSSAIRNGLEELSFVKKAEIVALTNSGEVVFEDQPNIDQVLETISDLGYDATVENIRADTSPSREHDNANRSTYERTAQIKVDGMFCEACPPRVREKLDMRFGNSVTVEKSPTLKAPILTVTYRPELPHLTIRSILATIEDADASFTVSIHHPPSREERSKQMEIKQRNSILRRLVIALVFVIPTFVVGVVIMDLLPDSSSIKARLMHSAWVGNVPLGEWIMFILATPVYFFAADIFHRRALKEVRALWRPGSRIPVARRFYRFGSMNLLISAGTTVAYAASIAVLIIGATGHSRSTTNLSYFDSVVFLTFFILAGRYLEAYSKARTSDAVSMLSQLRPAKAMLVVSQSDASSTSSEYLQPNKTLEISVDLLEVGDRVIVVHGSSPPADGLVISGEGSFDESSLTGESRAVKKSIDEKVFVGTINKGNPITMEVTDIGGGSMLDQIVKVVREGLSKRAPVERLADVLTGYFVPIITALAIITFIVWMALGYSGMLSAKYIAGQDGGWAFFSLGFAISVFVAACPCGIGLAAPTALTVGIGLAAKHGILVRGGGEAFQEAPHIDAVVFDKTGTLTEGGDVKVTNFECLDEGPPELVETIAARLEEQSSHPIAQAITNFLAARPQIHLEATDVAEIPGHGLQGTITHGDLVLGAAIGSPTFIDSLAASPLTTEPAAAMKLTAWQASAQSVACMALRRGDGPWRLAALFGTADRIRPSAAPTVRALHAQGLAVYMLSGDHPATAKAVAAQVGIPATHVFAGVLPTGKADKIRALQQAGIAGASRRRRWNFFGPTPAHPTPDMNNADPELGLASPATSAAAGPGAGRRARVAFVGDGINDAPALTAADVGIALATGSPAAATAAAVVLLRSGLTRVPRLLALSRRVMRRVAANYGWALIYNLLLVPVAAGVLFRTRPEGWILGPAWAALAMAGSSVSVVLSSLALKWEGRASYAEADDDE